MGITYIIVGDYMKINLTQEIKKYTLLSHVVLSCLTDTTIRNLIAAGRTEAGIVCEIKLMIDDHELDLASFLKHWQSQVSRMVKEKAIEIMKEKFGDIYDTLADLEDRLKVEVEKRLEDWEREIYDEER